MTTFKMIESNEALDDFLSKDGVTFLYISRPNCSVCVSLLPQIEKVFEDFPAIKTAYVNQEDVPEVAGRFNIFTVPVLILFVDGKEYLREARIVPIEPFKEKVSKIVNGYYNQHETS
ncbi:thioredoxin-like protein YdfQ [Halolactibacillus alkaliphilus]|uniref:Thioredoxin-like protein YdfQ n=1 Tax=Halolactibacillus alkaliphilus TaxID=442899 RepID=A0A511X3T3_9BACI|nr:thioredoxin family protein [Halolactibacillus alkaliphilus]GEN57601.1 thioredoxin-like protein YdfQ [Halolactibacillus alkaliphilus]GGN74442.1 thioredoxin-like protein YdfQ [Halolactibacillus alkaliphilus]SFP01502.1 Thioredoxin [Halolactibacillus alkaliphilus]